MMTTLSGDGHRDLSAILRVNDQRKADVENWAIWEADLFELLHNILSDASVGGEIATHGQQKSAGFPVVTL
ncbi:MAG: hypothetical protein U0798_11205 [Gemmataceae bacterium]